VGNAARQLTHRRVLRASSLSRVPSENQRAESRRMRGGRISRTLATFAARPASRKTFCSMRAAVTPPPSSGSSDSSPGDRRAARPPGKGFSARTAPRPIEMPFPLGEWIDSHADLPHNLGGSGMKGSLRTLANSFRRLPPPDPERLRRELARSLGVPPDALFLTHGATEANALVLHHLSHGLRTTLGRTPWLRVERPEYPPIPDTAELAGFSVRESGRPADATALSAPRNPLGTPVGDGELEEISEGTRALLVDETFREFRDRPSAARLRRPGVWVTGTFTKAFGADDIRVGWVGAPPDGVESFARYHGLATDRVATHSVAAALALLRDRRTILAESRGIVRANERALREAFPDLPPLGAPVWLDRGVDGDRLARRAVRAGVLVCPGSFFGVPKAVRLGLTRRSFPSDLAAYLDLRRRRH
jgi:histidinol-phosphate/aromatic aminotransferase/cobyric acid decarboxylase-like protein